MFLYQNQLQGRKIGLPELLLLLVFLTISSHLLISFLHIFTERIAFQFIQDPIEYSTRTHHSNMDVYDHLMQDDLKQIATIVATFALNAAQQTNLMPRK